MKPLIQHLRIYWPFYLLSIVVIITGLLTQLFFEKGELVLLFNNNQSHLLNISFQYLTMLGEFVGGALVFVLLASFAKSKYMIIFLVAVGISTGASQLLKRGVFNKEKRPSAFYEELNTIKDLKRHTDLSFPSGHTTAAFTFFTILALSFKKVYVQVLSSIIATLVAISRVYLGQHFLNDVVAGAVLGIMLATIVFLYLDRKLIALKLNKRLTELI